MIGYSDVFVTAALRSFRHGANGSGAVTPFSMHLQITAQARLPAGMLFENRLCLRPGKEIAPNVRPRIHRGRISYPSLQQFLQKRSNAGQLRQRTALPKKLDRFDWPREG